MSDYKKILDMIEGVDPKDTCTLDEIDARSWCWLEEYIFKNGVSRPYGKLDFNELVKTDKGYYWTNGRNKKWAKKYTTSRDALKAIRPEGWEIAIHEHCYGAFTVFLDNEQFRTPTSEGATEELAELHAIISAIQGEKDNEQ